MAAGSIPAGKTPLAVGPGTAGAKLPLPSPIRMVTVLSLWLAMAKSGMRSPLKSAETIAVGLWPEKKGLLGEGENWARAGDTLAARQAEAASVSRKLRTGLMFFSSYTAAHK